MKLHEIQFLGHSAVVLRGDDDVSVAIDPWLAGNPACPEEFKELKKLDYLVLTHGHADHASDAVLLATSTGCKILATFELCSILAEEGVSQEQLCYMNKGGGVTLSGLRITLTHAFHSSSYQKSNGDVVYAGEPCGVVVQDQSGNSIYHAGDTCLFSDMLLIGELYKPTIALLPIGDNFTMGQAEAARAARMLGCSRTVPLHYKTFPQLEQDAEVFIKECAQSDIEVTELDPGQCLRI